MMRYGLRLYGFVQKRRAAAPLGGFLWGLVEGTFFFIVPDVWVSLAGLVSLRKMLLALLGALAGSLVAGLLWYGLASVYAGDAVLSAVGYLPGVTEGMQESAGEVFQEGVPLEAQAPGAPYKVYAAAAATSGAPLGLFLLWTLVVRLLRMLPTLLGMLVLRKLFAESMATRPQLWLAIHAAFWINLYFVLFVLLVTVL